MKNQNNNIIRGLSTGAIATLIAIFTICFCFMFTSASSAGTIEILKSLRSDPKVTLSSEEHAAINTAITKLEGGAVSASAAQNATGILSAAAIEAQKAYNTMKAPSIKEHADAFKAAAEALSSVEVPITGAVPVQWTEIDECRHCGKPRAQHNPFLGQYICNHDTVVGPDGLTVKTADLELVVFNGKPVYKLKKIAQPAISTPAPATAPASPIPAPKPKAKANSGKTQLVPPLKVVGEKK